MKKIFFLFTVLVIIFAPSDFSFKTKGNSNTFDTIFKLSAEDSVWVEATLSKLSLKEKCAQMIFASVWSKDIDTTSDYYKQVLELVTKHKVGGIIYSLGKIEEQIQLTNTLQSLSKVPLKM